MIKKGIANLPLHSGKAPRWLFERMKKLSREIARIIIEEFGTEYFLDRITDPFWFQAFGCVLGFDWHSSGVTTTVCGALKEGIKDISKEIGIFVCGGKGASAIKTPEEIKEIGDKYDLKVNPENLIYSSRISAKIDNACIQDGYQLYHHTFIFDRKGNWAVIQQGMNLKINYARRYHWLSNQVKNFVCEPHKAICCDYKNPSLNMVAKESEKAREISLNLVKQPEKTFREFKRIKELNLKSGHNIEIEDINPENLKKILISTYEKNPSSYKEIIEIKGVGPKTIRALALISELIYGAPPSFNDPVRFSFAHGGKDGHPYPVDRKTYDESIEILRKAVEKSKLEYSEKFKVLRSLFSTF